jgi:hypothetical protein
MVTAILLIHLFNLIKVARWNIQKHSYYTDFQLVFPNSHIRVCFKVNHGCFICLILIIMARWNITTHAEFHHLDYSMQNFILYCRSSASRHTTCPVRIGGTDYGLLTYPPKRKITRSRKPETCIAPVPHVRDQV